MTRIALRLSLLSVAVFVFPGCLELALIQALERDEDVETYDEYDYEYEDTSDDTWTSEWDTSDTEDDYYDSSVLDIRGASLAGNMGDVHDFWDDTPTTNGYDYGSYSSLEIHAAATDGAAMAILDAQGGFQHADLAPGAHLEFSNYSSTPDGLYMYVIGCAGPSEGNWSYDEQAEELVVDVSATPEGGTVLDFTATFYDGQTVVGTAELGAVQAQ